jgi:hypothetical protein
VDSSVVGYVASFVIVFILEPVTFQLLVKVEQNLAVLAVLGVNAETCSVGCAWRECRNLQCWLCLA